MIAAHPITLTFFWQVGISHKEAQKAQWVRYLCAFCASRGDRFAARGVTPVGIYSCIGMRDATMEPILRKALMSQELLKVKSLRLEPHEEEETCLVHGAVTCFSKAEINATP